MLLSLLFYVYPATNLTLWQKLPGDQSNHSLISLFNNKFTYLDDILTVNSANLFTSVEENFVE